MELTTIYKSVIGLDVHQAQITAEANTTGIPPLTMKRFLFNATPLAGSKNSGNSALFRNQLDSNYLALCDS